VRVGTQSQIDGRFLSSFSQTRVIEKPESPREESSRVSNERAAASSRLAESSIDFIRDLRNGADARACWRTCVTDNGDNFDHDAAVRDQSRISTLIDVKRQPQRVK